MQLHLMSDVLSEPPQKPREKLSLPWKCLGLQSSIEISKRLSLSTYAPDIHILVLLKLAQISSTLQSLVEPVELGELEELRRKRRRGSGFAEEKKTARLVLTTTASQHYSIWPKISMTWKKKISRLLTFS